jgi:peptide alpha-N-acetyltransferase
MPISVRRALFDDLLGLQNACLHCLAENYNMWYWVYHMLTSAPIIHVATNQSRKILGYVLAKIDEQGPHSKPPVPLHGLITSVSVYGHCRKLGLAAKMLSHTHSMIWTCFGAEYVQLHVRETNRAGRHLYAETLGYQFIGWDKKYYTDGEDALRMKLPLPKSPS